MSLPTPILRLLLVAAALLTLLSASSVAVAGPERVTSRPGAPLPFDVDAPGTTTVYGVNADGDSYVPVTLPQTVRVDGRSYSQATISANNAMSLINGDGTFSTDVYLFSGYDSTTGTNGGVHVQSQGDLVVVQWNINRYPRFSSPYSATMQAVFSTTHDTVEFRYGGGGEDFTGRGSATVADNTGGAFREGTYADFSGQILTFSTVSIDEIDSPSTDSTPTVGGSSAASGEVTVTVREGTGVDGAVVETLVDEPENSTFSVTAASLPDGVYTASAVQNGRIAAPVTFIVDRTAPTPTLVAPATDETTADRTPTFSGSAGADRGDAGTVDVEIRRGTDPSGETVETLTAPTDGGTFAVESSTALEPGRYTAVVRQTDDVGNAGESAPTGFRVLPDTDLSLTASASPESVTVGDTVTQTLVVRNAGSSAPSSVLTEPVPAGASLVSASSSAGSCSGDATVVCDLGDLADGASTTVDIVLRAQTAGSLVATANVESEAGDVDSSNDSATTTTRVVEATPVVNVRAPIALTGSGESLGQHAVRVSGTVDAEGGPTTYVFEYGLDRGYGSSSDAFTVSGDAEVAVSALLSGLRLGETYHYRLRASNAAGESIGADRTIRTLGRTKARSFVAKARVKRDARLPYRFSFSGRVSLPAGVQASEGCDGNVSVAVKTLKGLTVSNRVVRVRRDCTWSSSVTFRKRSRLGSGGRLRVRIRYSGGKALLAAEARPLSVRFR